MLRFMNGSVCELVTSLRLHMFHRLCCPGESAQLSFQPKLQIPRVMEYSFQLGRLPVEKNTISFPLQVQILILTMLKIGKRMRTLFMSGISFAFYLALVIEL